MKTCKGVPKGACDLCKQLFPTKDILYKHRKHCNGIINSLIPSSVGDGSTVNITINYINNNVTNTDNSTKVVNLLKFPEEDNDADFDFTTEHITNGY
jgi:hypothetical protein